MSEEKPSQANNSSADDKISSGSIKDAFKEVKEVEEIIKSLNHVYKNQIAVEMAVERFQFIVDEYQEQPHLLDPHLESLLDQLLSIARDEKTPAPVMHLAFKLLYLITKTRGFKIVVRLFPHEVADVEPVLALLSQQSPSSYNTWETRYILLLWLSMVCMIPFDMVKLDSNARSETGEVRKPVTDRIIEAGQLYLDGSDKSRDAAAYMLSRFMTRPDVKKHKFPEFLDWCLTQLARAKSGDMSIMQGMNTVSGILSTLALLFKQGKREDLVDHASVVLKVLIDLGLNEAKNTVLHKLYTKLAQRIGLTFLKARVAAWRYQRGSRSLADNLSQAQPREGAAVQQSTDDEEYDIPDELEDVIEILLTSLRCEKGTVVRWSAAKGIGRLTGRLPQELADEVVGSIMEVFTIGETDGAWHGGCLALAELGRRGLLLPSRLPTVVPVIIRALRYDEKRGNFSVGAHVRDSACYICWAFARAYDPKELAPHVTDIATALVLVSLFDREVNVRRAAAAAFQENVGRQGQFPHGIDILTTCDYFAVGNRTNCFLELSVFVAQFSEYTHSMIDHLLDYKLGHWDSSIRELASQALHNLTPSAPTYMSQTVLPKLLVNTCGVDSNLRHASLRHGSILAIAEIIHALAVINDKENKTSSEFLSKDVIDGVKSIADKLHEADLFKGYGGELMRKAVCCLIAKSSLARLPYRNDGVIVTWQALIDDCLQHQEHDVQMAAVGAIPAFFSQYYIVDNNCDLQIQGQIMQHYIKHLQDSTESTRMGFALAIGAFPKAFMRGKLNTVLAGLMQASRIQDRHVKMAEARRDAIKAIASVSTTVGVQISGQPNDVVCEDNIAEIYDSFFLALNDYTLDSRGDVGAWVREAAMTGLHDVTVMLVNDAPALLEKQEDRCRQMFCALIQQSVEKIDRTRAHAGDVFGKLLHHTPPVPHVPHRETLLELFPETECAGLNWAAPSSTFPKFTQLLRQRTYTYSVLLGMTVSVGGLTESLVKHSAHSMLDYLRSIRRDVSELRAFSDVLLQVFRDYSRVDRVTLPMFKMLDQLMTNNCFESLTPAHSSEFALQLFELSKQEITRCGDVQKLLASVDVLCNLLQYEGDVRKKILTQLAIFMCHRFPIVRKTAAGKLFETVIMFDGLVSDENLEELNTLLSETQWDHPVNEVRPIRNKVCLLLDISPPVALKKAPGGAAGDTQR